MLQPYISRNADGQCRSEAKLQQQVTSASFLAATGPFYRSWCVMQPDISIRRVAPSQSNKFWHFYYPGSLYRFFNGSESGKLRFPHLFSNSTPLVGSPSPGSQAPICSLTCPPDVLYVQTTIDHNQGEIKWPETHSTCMQLSFVSLKQLYAKPHWILWRLDRIVLRQAMTDTVKTRL